MKFTFLLAIFLLVAVSHQACGQVQPAKIPRKASTVDLIDFGMDVPDCPQIVGQASNSSDSRWHSGIRFVIMGVFVVRSFFKMQEIAKEKSNKTTPLPLGAPPPLPPPLDALASHQPENCETPPPLPPA